VSAYTHSRQNLVCTLSPSPNPIDGTTQNRKRDFFPDFVLIRNEVYGVQATQDYRNLLIAFLYAGIPSVNSFDSIYHFLERPIIHSELLKVARRVGDENFPVIPQSYFANFDDMTCPLPFPVVAKVGHAHAGYGKMRLQNQKEFESFRSVIALTGKYVTIEPFLEGDYDIRIQKIGQHLRAYKRISLSGNWKTNTGSSHVEEIEITPQYRMWAEEASKFFGGLDICTVDAIHTSDGKEYILEVNGTSSGLHPSREDEDNAYICDLVIQKMQEKLYSNK
jgi:synapsin